MKKIFTFDGDKNRNLKLGFNGIINLEKELGKSLMDLKDGLTFEDMRTFFYVALKWEDKELTHEQTGEIIEEAIDKHGLEYVSKKLEEVITSTFGKTAVPSEK